MPEHLNATYLPLATERTKNVIKHIQPGTHQTIDAIHARGHAQRIETDVWAVQHDDGVHTYYQDGPSGGVMYLGIIERVRDAIAKAKTESNT